MLHEGEGRIRFVVGYNWFLGGHIQVVVGHIESVGGYTGLAENGSQPLVHHNQLVEGVVHALLSAGHLKAQLVPLEWADPAAARQLVVPPILDVHQFLMLKEVHLEGEWGKVLGHRSRPLPLGHSHFHTVRLFNYCIIEP